MSTRVLLATLSIPITPERTDIARLLDMDGIIVEKHRRLATLLGLQSPPTRQSLINDMVILARLLRPPPIYWEMLCVLPMQHRLQQVTTLCAGEVQSSPVHHL